MTCDNLLHVQAFAFNQLQLAPPHPLLLLPFLPF
jgi:hypothetical protein